MPVPKAKKNVTRLPFEIQAVLAEIQAKEGVSKEKE